MVGLPGHEMVHAALATPSSFDRLRTRFDRVRMGFDRVRMGLDRVRMRATGGSVYAQK